MLTVLLSSSSSSSCLYSFTQYLKYLNFMRRQAPYPILFFNSIIHPFISLIQISTISLIRGGRTSGLQNTRNWTCMQSSLTYKIFSLPLFFFFLSQTRLFLFSLYRIYLFVYMIWVTLHWVFLHLNLVFDRAFSRIWP